MGIEQDYIDGKCRDCKITIEPLGPSSRCGSCDTKFSAYMDSGWGLNSLIEERNQNQVLGICFYCGNGLEGPDERLCKTCQMQTENGSWSRGMYRKGRQSISDKNPYNNVWDSHDTDNAVHLDATFATVAERMLSKAKYCQMLSGRGGPRGREALKDAQIYVRIAFKMLEKEKEIRKKSL